MASLTDDQKLFLLRLARSTIETYLAHGTLHKVDKTTLPEEFLRDGAVFVTLTKAGSLRGCIGSLQAFQPLYLDVQERAIQAATEDQRFPQLKASELPAITIEISILSAPQQLEYAGPAELPEKLRPGMDGVILQDGTRRATFLPQVWDQLPQPEEFLAHLCNKMGAPANLWKTKMLDVQIYQVEEFKEE